MAHRLRLGSRPSRLALAQAAIVSTMLKKVSPDLKVEVVEVQTSGDRITSPSLVDVGGKGLFVKELEAALAARAIDAAVHSMKDLPARVAPEFAIAAVLEREDPRDVLVSRDGTPLAELNAGARVGTSSARRKYLAKKIAPAIQVLTMRGNVDTRLEKLTRGEYDAIIVAAAGLKRLGKFDSIKKSILDTREFIPAAAQGALAIEILRDRRDAEFAPALRAINHAQTAYVTAAERAVLATLNASCATPIGVHASLDSGRLLISAILFSADGTRWMDESLNVEADSDLAPSHAENAGESLATKLIARGADSLIA